MTKHRLSDGVCPNCGITWADYYVEYDTCEKWRERNAPRPDPRRSEVIAGKVIGLITELAEKEQAQAAEIERLLVKIAELETENAAFLAWMRRAYIVISYQFDSQVPQIEEPIDVWDDAPVKAK